MGRWAIRLLWFWIGLAVGLKARKSNGTDT